LEHDRDRKGSLYARAGIADYWIVNLPERRLEVYREPAQSRRTLYGWDLPHRSVLSAWQADKHEKIISSIRGFDWWNSWKLLPFQAICRIDSLTNLV
jgi:hypothetical protein